jgi:nicotinamide riboside transporter PnuC
VEQILHIIERAGFPIFVVLWFMWREHRHVKDQIVVIKEQNRLLHRLVVVNTVIAKTLDLPDEAVSVLSERNSGE